MDACVQCVATVKWACSSIPHLFDVYSAVTSMVHRADNMHRPYHQSRTCMVPVTLITVADGVCHLTSAALIIGRQGWRSIYPDRCTITPPKPQPTSFCQDSWQNVGECLSPSHVEAKSYSNSTVFMLVETTHLTEFECYISLLHVRAFTYVLPNSYHHRTQTKHEPIEEPVGNAGCRCKMPFLSSGQQCQSKCQFICPALKQITDS